MRRARSLAAAEDGTPTRRPIAVADSPFVRFMEFQPLPSPAAVAKAKAASSPGPPLGLAGQKENAPQDMFSRLLAQAVAGVGGKGAPRDNSRGVALARKPESMANMSMQQLSLATATASMEMTSAVERHAKEPPNAPKPFVHEPDVIDRAKADLAKRKERELARTRALAAKIKKGPQPPSNIFLPRAGLNDGSADDEEEALISTDWEALPAGTQISVWWEGNQESFECTIRDWHVAVGADGKLFYTHRCEYDGGTFDHDLSKCHFEVLESAPCHAVLKTHSGETPRAGPRFSLGADAPVGNDGGLPLTDRSDEGYVKGRTPDKMAEGSLDGSFFANNFEELTPKRRWLAKQEAQLNEFCEELEAADIATPIHAMAGTQKLRGRIALKRFKQPQEATPRTPRAGTGRLTSRFGPSSLLGSPRTPRQDDGSGVPVVDPSDPHMTYRKVFQTPGGVPSSSLSKGR